MSKMMRMCKAPELLKKAATVFRSKTEALRTKLVVLASLRRKLAAVGAISRRIHALVSSDREKQQARLEYGDGTLVLRKAATGILLERADHGHDDGVIDLSEVAMFEEDNHGYPDWTHSLFDDDGCYNGDLDEEGHGVIDVLDEPSVMDVIRSNREVEGLEFNMDDEIDQACDMFIRRFRKRMMNI